MNLLVSGLASLGIALTPATAQNACGFTKAFDRPDERGKIRVNVYEGAASPGIGGSRPLAFVTTLKVNTDGTRISYKADDPRGQNGAINDIRNAFRNPKRPVADFEAVRDAGWKPDGAAWRVLGPRIIEADRRGSANGAKPCLDPQGYLISMTADVAVDGGFARVGDCDQSKWIDALSIPAIVLPNASEGLPSEFSAKNASTRHVAIVMTLSGQRRIAYGVVGDKGPENELGEASVEMNRILNGLPAGARPGSYQDAKDHFQAGKSVVLIFPGPANRLARPITPARVHEFAKQQFIAWGGEQRLLSCLNEIPEAR